MSSVQILLKESDSKKKHKIETKLSQIYHQI